MGNRNTLLVAVVLPLLCATAAAQTDESWRCAKAQLTRNVDVFYPEAPASLRCKVYYSKPKENVIPRVLWTAKNDAGFCRSRAAEFVSRLQAWGWQCTAQSAGADAKSWPGSVSR